VSGGQPDLDKVLHQTLLGDALGNAEIAALLADEFGQYVAVNDRACELTGYDRRVLTAFRAGELAADEASRGIYAKVAGGALRGDKRVRRRDGAEVPCRYFAIPTRVARLPYFILLLWPAAGAGW
jgi:PAS domain S-box-containing protein